MDPSAGPGDAGSCSPSAAKKSGKILAVRVQMLDDSITLFQIQAKALGSVLFEQVCKQLNLLEADYFGLEYTGCSGTNRFWVDMDKPMNRQLELSLSDSLLRFSVKFYSPDPAQLEEEFTRYLFCMQIKQDLAQGVLQCNDKTAALLASYLVQAECGDYVAEDYPDHTYLSSFKFVPMQDSDLERRIMDNHKKHIGQSPAEADLNLLETARRCELYGVKMHAAKDPEGVPLNVAVANVGVLVFQNFAKINTFSWAKIRKLSFKRKKFLIKLHPESHGSYKDVVEFYFDGRDECKNFWKKCVEHHGFFRCSTGRAAGAGARPKPRVLSRGSSFRYTGRTQKEVVEFVRENYVKRQSFQRSQSFRHTSPMHSSAAGVGNSLSVHPLLPVGEQAVGATLSSQELAADRCSLAEQMEKVDVHHFGSSVGGGGRDADGCSLAPASPAPSTRSIPATYHHQHNHQQQQQQQQQQQGASQQHHVYDNQPAPGVVAAQAFHSLPRKASSASPMLPAEIEQQEQLDQVNNMININNSAAAAAAAAGENDNSAAAADDDVQDAVPPTATAPATPVLSPPPLLNNEPVEHNNNIQQQVVASAKTNGQLVDGDGSRNKRYPTDKSYYMAKELLMTERTYRKDLEVVDLWFRDELSRGECMPEEVLNLLFNHVEPIYEHHSSILKELEQRLAAWESRSNGNTGQRVGDILLRIATKIDLYNRYIERHRLILEKLEHCFKRSKKFEQIYRDFETQKVCYLPLNTFLLRPLQRILHYHLLVERLVKHYDPTHPDMNDCVLAKMQLEPVIANITQTIHTTENFIKLVELQRDLVGIDNIVHHSREFLREGCLQKLSRKGFQQRMFFLFSDVLLYTNRTSGPQLQFKVHGQLPLRGIMVEDSDPKMGNQFCFTIYGGNRALLVAASTQEEKDKWVEDIHEAVAAAREMPDDISRMNYFSLKSCSSSEEVLDKSVEDFSVSVTGNKERSQQQRSNTTVHVCWHRNTSISSRDHLLALENQLSGYLLRKFKNSNGWQKLWVVFTNFCLFFYKTFQDDFPLASLPLLGYTVTSPTERDHIHKDYVFKLQFKNHVYFFRAESEYTFNRWMEVISSATQHSGRLRLFSRKESQTHQLRF